MKPFEDVKTLTPVPVASRNTVANGEDDEEDKDEINSNNNSNKSLDSNNHVNPIIVTPSSSCATTKAAVLETDKSNVTTNSTNKSKNVKGKEDSVKTQNTTNSQPRGRKTTSVNFLPCDCKLCGEKFNSDKDLGYHIRDVHVVGKKDKKEVIVKKKPKDYHYVRGKDWKVLNPKRPYCCTTCKKRFLYESSLNHHKVVKHNEKIGEDEDANGSNNTNGNLSTTTTSTGNSNIPPKIYNHTFQCDQCGKILMSKHSLIRHLVSFHGTDHEKPFQCDICGQRYVSISSLVSHRRKEHTGDKPYVCEHCGKAFTMSNRLKCHLRVHSDEKFYKCQQCSKQFKSCSAFRAHKDTHLGVMRHTCKYCERKFLFQGNMIKHIRRRHPNGEKLTTGSNDGGGTESGLTIINNPLDTNTNSLVFTSEGNHHNLPVEPVETTGNNQTNLTVNGGGGSGNHVLHPSVVASVASTMTANPVPITPTANSVSSSRRSNNNQRYFKTIQSPDHLYFTKEMTINVHPHSHMDILEQQQQNMQSLSPLEQFVQPEIQFQVLPLSSLPNQELFNNGVNNYQSANINQTNSEATSTSGSGGGNCNNNNSGLNQGQSIGNNHPRDSRLDFTASQTSGKCRLCDQSFSDIRYHITDFHRIPIQKVESMMATMIYF